MNQNFQKPNWYLKKKIHALQSESKMGKTTMIQKNDYRTKKRRRGENTKITVTKWVSQKMLENPHPPSKL